MRHKLLAAGYLELGFVDGLFNTIWHKQVGPLLLTWHYTPHIKIDVNVVTSDRGNVPFCTINAIGLENKTVEQFEQAILEMYKVLRVDHSLEE